MASPAGNLTFLFDVDNTLLDNDRVTQDLRRHLENVVGVEGSTRYWEIFEQLRAELGYADYLGALQRYRTEYPCDSNLLVVSSFLVDYPFAERLYPGALDSVRYVQQWGAAVIVSDGDVVFQPRKVLRSGIFDAFAGKVLLYVHKETNLDDIERRFPARHYVFFDDKIRILTAVKKIWGTRVTTVFVRQGHYALDAKLVAAYPAADLSVDHIRDLLALDFSAC